MGFTGSGLLPTAQLPGGDVSDGDWRDLGDWLLLASRVGADRVFFVRGDPVLLFSALPPDASGNEIFEVFRRAWSMAQPRCLFLAVGDELRVYSLSHDWLSEEDPAEALSPIAVVERAADVATELREFRRERIDSGRVFDELSDALDAGAHGQLLRDVAYATEAFVEMGLSRGTAHALIERAILVRYLEDRGVLPRSYFEDIARERPEWAEVIANSDLPAVVESPSAFILTLSNPAFASRVFARLTEDFNGDLFANHGSGAVDAQPEHLLLLRDMLLGVGSAAQMPLFLWAYDFSVVPTSLVSTMYELFYQQGTGSQARSTHYTPPELVDSILAEVLTEVVLDMQPRVCDPSCGSGVFLVGAYQRIVRHEMARRGTGMDAGELRDILLSRLVGIDVNAAAIQLAAFSLYVAMLNYLSPADIRDAGPLPKLVATTEVERPLVVGDAFDRSLPGVGEFEVVVGNPPWTKSTNEEMALALAWVKQMRVPVGAKSPSQLFVWKALDLLKPGGTAALLVGAKALLNEGGRSRAFRSEWLKSARLRHVVNFVEVRHDYFQNADAPFSMIRFEKRSDDTPLDGPVIYETVKGGGPQRGELAFARLDRRIVSQRELRETQWTWKAYMSGGHRDVALVNRLAKYGTLGDLTDPSTPSGHGYQLCSEGSAKERKITPTELRSLRSLREFTFWGPLEASEFGSVPECVKRVPHEALFSGQRLIVRLGVVTGFGLHARLETDPFAFQHAVYAVPLRHLPKWQAQVILGILLSSIGRYWLAMVSGGWGSWFEQVRSSGLLQLPVRTTDAGDLAVRAIDNAVLQLRDGTFTRAELRSFVSGGPGGPLADALSQLDIAVAELFEMDEAERDLVNDYWLAQTASSSAAVAGLGRLTGTAADLAAMEESPLTGYLRTFLDTWNAQLAPKGELAWSLKSDPAGGARAVVFSLIGRGGAPPDPSALGSNERWGAALQSLSAGLTEEKARGFLTHGIMRAVTADSIVIAKRDELRLWTATAAREDAEATSLQAMEYPNG